MPGYSSDVLDLIEDAIKSGRATDVSDILREFGRMLSESDMQRVTRLIAEYKAAPSIS